MMSWMLTQIQKGGLCPSKFLPLMTEFSVSTLLQVIVTENNWLVDASLKAYKLIWKTKLSEMETRDFDCALDKTDRDEGNKTQIRYRCHSNFALSKLIMDNGLEDLWRRENADFSEFTQYDRSSGTRSKIDRVYTGKKIGKNTKIIHKMISFSDHYNALFIDRFSSKTKI